MKAIFLGLLVVGSVVIFVLGVMVGNNVRVPPEAVKGYSPGHASPGPQAAAEKGEAPLREEVTLPRKGVEVKGEEMTFYDTLNKTERPEPAPAGAPVIPTPPAPPVVAQPEAAPAALEETASPEAKEEAAPRDAGDKPPAPARPAPASGIKYSIQVMATKDAKEAKTAAAALSKAGFNAYTAVTARGRLNAVRVGRTATEAEARKIQSELAKKTKYKDGYLVKE